MSAAKNSKVAKCNFIPVNDETLVDAIRHACDSLVIIAPILRKSVADAVAERWELLGPGNVAVTLSTPQAYCKVDAADGAALDRLIDTAKRLGTAVQWVAGLRSGILVGDGLVFVFDQLASPYQPSELLVNEAVFLPEGESRSGPDKRDFPTEPIIQDLAKGICRRIAHRAKRELQAMKAHGLSGEDSGLRNTWDEICVQLQDEGSIFWDAYEHTVQSVVARQVDQLAPSECQAVWLQTPAAEEWAEGDHDSRGADPVLPEEVVDYIVQEFVFVEAGNWTNPQIRAYLERPSD